MNYLFRNLFSGKEIVSEAFSFTEREIIVNAVCYYFIFLFFLFLVLSIYDHTALERDGCYSFLIMIIRGYKNRNYYLIEEKKGKETKGNYESTHVVGLPSAYSSIVHL